MFLQRKETIMPVDVGTPDARFGCYLLEQFGGAGRAHRGIAILGAIVPCH
jgi:hypothetical protein